mmetsp:Transcript_15593/g.28354  ORF Transcript_15593/g.28354 Transcript_15593/m.28354 type:complete len:254 (+) Transcript_15593:547-1308(+)
MTTDIFGGTLFAECLICYAPHEEPITLDNCQHIFGADCLRNHIEFSLAHGHVPIKCPRFGCTEVLNESDLRHSMTDLLEVFSKQTLLAFRNYNALQECYNPTCDYFFELTAPANSFFCPKCFTLNCIRCKTVEHYELTCDEYQSITVYDDNFYDAVSEFSYKQCPKCLFYVEKNQGCNHMTCRCGFQFCYACGGVYKKCTCTGHKNTLIFERMKLFAPNPDLAAERKECMGEFMKHTYIRPVRNLADFFYEEA